MSGSWVVAPVDATLREGVCAAASRSSGEMGREHVGTGNVTCRRWNRGLQGIFRVDASERELCERELGGGIGKSSDVRDSLRSCIQKKSGVRLQGRRGSTWGDATL